MTHPAQSERGAPGRLYCPGLPNRAVYERRVETFLQVFRRIGREIRQEDLLVDLGCANGDLVAAFRDRGYHAFGCDIRFEHPERTADLAQRSILRLITSDRYRLPFSDSSVDVLISDQVMEHVADYATTLREIHRVLKPGGMSLHIFPSRYRIIESHTGIPLASVIRSVWWLTLWARLGVRGGNQRGHSVEKTVARTRPYLTTETFYRTRRSLAAEAGAYFPVVLFQEKAFLDQRKKGSFLLRLPFASWFLPRLYSAFGSRVLFLQKK